MSCGHVFYKSAQARTSCKHSKREELCIPFTHLLKKAKNNKKKKNMSQVKGVVHHHDDSYSSDDYGSSSDDGSVEVNVNQYRGDGRGYHMGKRRRHRGGRRLRGEPQVVYVTTGEEQKVGAAMSDEEEFPSDEERADNSEIGEEEEEEIETHITDQDFRDGVHEQEYYVEIEGSLNEFGEVEGLAEWSALPGNEHIYQPVASTVDGVQQRGGDITKGLLLDARWEWVNSTAPPGLDIGLNISGTHGNVHTARGKTFSIIAPAGKMVTSGKSCFKPTDVISRNALENYDVCNIEELDNDIKEEKGKSWDYVKRSSVIINLLQANMKAFNIKRLDLPKNPDDLVKVPSAVIAVCKDYLLKKQDIPFTNFNTFKVTADRVDGEAWDSTKNVINDIAGHEQEEQSYYETTRMDNKFKITGLLVLKKALYGKGKQ